MVCSHRAVKILCIVGSSLLASRELSKQELKIENLTPFSFLSLSPAHAVAVISSWWNAQQRVNMFGACFDRKGCKDLSGVGRTLGTFAQSCVCKKENQNEQCASHMKQGSTLQCATRPHLRLLRDRWATNFSCCRTKERSLEPLQCDSQHGMPCLLPCTDIGRVETQTPSCSRRSSHRRRMELQHP